MALLLMHTMPKPSERIKEIACKLNKNPNSNDLEYVIVQIQAIMNYFDEEYEKEQERIKILKAGLVGME